MSPLDPLHQLRETLGDRYRVERRLGEGGMALVYLATDLKHGRQVAIKVLHPEIAATVGSERFLREIEIAAQLQHPHILPVYDSGDAGGVLYFVMPYVAGESLQDRITRSGPLSPEEAVEVAREVAGALDYAHGQGIVHRDIKPANILLSQGHAQVADFGIARAISASAGAGRGLTQAGMAIGTPSYMSPEQALGDGNVDGRTDLYALGCVLYEMLSGRAPYEGTTPQAVVAQAISGAVPRLGPNARGLQPVVDRAMAKEPADRFQTASELIVALRSPQVMPVGVRRHRRAWMGAGAAAVAALLVAFWWPRGYRVAGDPRQSLVIFPFENRTGDPNQDYLQEASLNLLGLAVAHWEDLRVYDDERTASLLRRRGIADPADLDFEVARELAREARVGTLVLGDLRKEGDSLAVEAKVHDVRSGERLATEVMRVALSADPRPVFDSLAVRILRVSGAPPGERPELVSQTTRSLEAYRAYLQGVDALQQFNTDSARALLERAVALDSTFALAYLRLRDVDGWAGIEADPARRRVWIANAEAHSAALPPRLRALVQFHVAYEAGELPRARRIVEQLIARDSSDTEAWYQLGEAHYHDNPFQFPHPDTAGNHGKALYAFRRALASNPQYVLAYQHILDALQNCDGVSPWLCMGDSAVYGQPAELDRRYGAERVARLRREAGHALSPTAAAWVEAAPRSGRARTAYLGILLRSNRLAEARSQVDGLRAGGDPTLARVWGSFVLLREGRYADAADTVEAALADSRGFLRSITGMGPDQVVAGLLAGGRTQAAVRLRDDVLRAITPLRQPINGPGNVPLTPAALALVLDLRVAGELGVDSAAPGRLARRWLDTLDSLFARDSASRQRALIGSSALLLASYLGSRDTSMLARYFQEIDTTGFRTWRVMAAELALARGDTALARRRVARDYAGAADSVEFIGDPGAVRVLAWGDVLTSLGDYDEALNVYGWLDSTSARLARPGMQVRSWAERGALYQQRGDVARATAAYEKVIAAWERGDESVQPFVDRARSAIRALRGETLAPARR